MKPIIKLITKPIINFFTISFLFSVIIFNSAQGQSVDNQESKADYSTYKNRVSINLLALPSSNLVMSYERAFKNQAIWIGYNYHLNGLLKEEDRNMSSIAAEYRYYFFSNKTNKFSDGLFAGIYSKYKTGKEIKGIRGDDEAILFSHSYTTMFAGLNLGYRYNYKRLALSTFAGYGFLISSSETGSSQMIVDEQELKFNEGYKKDLRLGITLGFAF